jgi:hypothetical protein
MNFLSVLYAKAGITVDGVTTLNNTATGQTPATNDNSTKLATTGFVKNQNYYPYPTGTTSQYVRGDGSLATFPSVASEAKTLITEVYNESGSTMTKGTVVLLSVAHGNLPTIVRALATGDALSAQTYGVVQNDITNNNNGFVVVIGLLENLATNAYVDGQILYLSSTTAGQWTSVKQYAPAHLVYVGMVVRAHPTQGVVAVRIQNGYEMDELHNVSAQSPSNGDILQYVTSTSLWTKIAGNTTAIAEGTNLYYTDVRSRAALSFIAGSGAYNTTTGVITIPTDNNQITNGAGYITSAALSAYVPYTGATANVNLGAYELFGKYLNAEGSAGLGGVLNIKQDAVYLPKGNGYSSIASSVALFDFYGYTGVSTYKNFALRFDGLTNNTQRIYTLPNASGTLALTSDLGAYLPLSGGTLTGALYGTSANFSSTITASQSNASAITSNLVLENFIATNPANGNGVAIDFKLNNNNNASQVLGRISLLNTFYRSNTDMIFSTALSDILTERMRLNSSGQLLLGTSTSGSYLLDVNGSGRFNGSLIFAEAYGLNGFSNGTGDGGTFTTYNFKLTGWDSMAFYNPTGGGSFPNQVSGLISFRNGTINMKGGFLVDGSIVLYAGNYNSYAPTLTGTGASGTWGISITGNANYATTAGALTSMLISQFTNDSGYITSSALGAYLPLAGGTLTGNLNATSATFSGVITLPQNPVGTTYGNGVAASPTYMITQSAGNDDAIRFYAESAATNQVTMVFEVNDDIETAGSEWIFRNKQTYGTYAATTPFRISGAGIAYANGYVVLTADNYNTYAPTLTGTGASGSWGISVTGNAATAGNATTTSQRNFSGDISTAGMGRFTGWYNGNAATGFAAEIGISAGQAYIIAYNRDTSTYGTVNLEGLNSQLAVGGSTVNVTIGALQQGGNQVLHAGNYNNYSPTLTGGGASGTWGISVTGSAATAGTATYASILSTTNQGIVGANGLTTVSSEAQWSNFPIGYSAMFLAGQMATGAPSGAYGFFIKIANRDAGGGWGGIWTDYSGGDTYVGNTTTSSTYANWYKLLSSTNYSSYALPLTGGTLTGALGGTSASFSSTITATNGIFNNAAGGSIGLKYGGTDDWVVGENAGAATRDFNIYNFNRTSIELSISRATGTATFASNVTANSFIKSGGTAAQFLKANGSVDSSTFVGANYGYSVPMTQTGDWMGMTTSSGISGWTHVINIAWDANTQNNWVSQIAFNAQNETGAYYRTTGGVITSAAWIQLIDGNNIGGYLSGYLPLSGGTITGNLTVNNRVYVGTGGCYLEQVLVSGVYELQVVDSAGNITVLS